MHANLELYCLNMSEGAFSRAVAQRKICEHDGIQAVSYVYFGFIFSYLLTQGVHVVEVLDF